MVDYPNDFCPHTPDLMGGKRNHLKLPKYRSGCILALPPYPSKLIRRTHSQNLNDVPALGALNLQAGCCKSTLRPLCKTLCPVCPLPNQKTRASE